MASIHYSCSSKHVYTNGIEYDEMSIWVTASIWTWEKSILCIGKLTIGIERGQTMMINERYDKERTKFFFWLEYIISYTLQNELSRFFFSLFCCLCLEEFINELKIFLIIDGQQLIEFCIYTLFINNYHCAYIISHTHKNMLSFDVIVSYWFMIYLEKKPIDDFSQQ